MYKTLSISTFTAFPLTASPVAVASPGLALENIVIPQLIAGKSKPDARVRATQLITAMGLEARAGHRPARLSGGEQQMLTIARTLMGNPAFILLDEPSEGIAPVIVEQMARVILQLKAEGLTVLLSEQNLHFAQAVADGVVIIEHGTQKFVGTLAALQSQPEIRDQYLSV